MKKEKYPAPRLVHTNESSLDIPAVYLAETFKSTLRRLFVYQGWVSKMYIFCYLTTLFSDRDLESL